MGERIAYAMHGEGPPLVCVAWWVSHVEEDWQHPGFRAFFGTLAERHTVIRYDRPGAGLSDRERGAVDLDSEVQTLGALLEHLGLQDVALFAIACAGPPAISYAAQNPERVSRLVFFGSYVSGEDVGNAEMRDAMQALVRANWGVGSKTLADLFAPDLDAEQRKQLSRSQRDAATSEMSARLLALSFDMEAKAQARNVQQPALVLHRKGDRTIPFRAGRELAATLCNASLSSLEGAAHLPWYGDVELASDAVLRFLGSARPEPTAEPKGNRLTRHGALWQVHFDGVEAHVPHALGITDLATLLENPREEIHAGTLWGGVSPQSHSDQEPMLDAQAMASYKERLREIETVLAECEERGQTTRAEVLRDEKNQLARELRAAVGLGGRKRGLKDVSERARKAVSARIRASIGKISEVHETLAEHLQASVTTGTFCSYTPLEGSSWVVSR